MGQQRRCDEQKELLAGAASPGCGPSLMGGTRDTGPALPCTSGHICQISGAQNDLSTLVMESHSWGPQCRVKPDLGELPSSPSFRTSSGKGWAGARDAKPRSPGAARASSEDVGPTQVPTVGTQPQGTARTERRETAQLSKSYVAGKQPGLDTPYQHTLIHRARLHNPNQPKSKLNWGRALGKLSKAALGSG